MWRAQQLSPAGCEASTSQASMICGPRGHAAQRAYGVSPQSHLCTGVQGLQTRKVNASALWRSWPTGLRCVGNTQRPHIVKAGSTKEHSNGLDSLIDQYAGAEKTFINASNATQPDAIAAAIPVAEAPTMPVLEALTGWRRRWTIVGLCFVAFLLCNLDRVNMSIAILPMSEQYGWSAQTMGLVQSSFFWGYLLTQIAGGVWADKYGGKRVLGLGVLWWSLATALTPLAAQAGLPALLAARAAMGVGEGVAMPAMNNLLSRWVPLKERSRSLALVYSGMFSGSILGLAASPSLVGAFGWPSVFYGFGALGIIWYLVWGAQASSNPTEDTRLSQEERDYILANTPGAQPVAATATAAVDGLSGSVVAGADGAAAVAVAGASAVTTIPWRALLSRREVWALIVCHFCHNWGTFILLTWMPSYYTQVLGLDLTQSGVLSVLPWMTMAVTANFAGWLADTLVDKGVDVTTVRKTMQTIGFLGPAFFLSQLSGVTSVPAAVACMMGAQGLDAFSQAGLYSNHQDIGPRYAGVLLGLSNTAGVLAGVLGSLATGYILSTSGWSQVWNVAVGLYLFGTLVWNLFASGKRIFD